MRRVPSTRSVRALAAACLALASFGGAAQITPGTAARVNGAPISVQQLERGFEQELRARNINIAAMRRPDTAREIKREVLERLIREELLWQKAQQDGLVAGEGEVDAAIERSAAQFKSRDSFERRIAIDGFDRKSYREYARRMLSADRAAQAVVEGRLEVSDEDLLRFYRDNPAHFHRPERLRLHVLQVRVAGGGGKEARERIEGLRKRLASGEDFEALARQYSDHPTRPWGGALDPVARGELPAPLEAAAFRLQAGELSGIVETPDGLYVLRLDERQPEVTVPFEAARGQIREYLVRTRGREVLDREVAALRAASKVEILLPQ